MTTTKDIRDAIFKATGLKAPAVTVKVSPCGYSQAFRITLRRIEAIPYLFTLKGLKDSFRHVRYCEVSGEVLEGANTYVDCSITEDLQQLLNEKYHDKCLEIWKAVLDLPRGQCYPIPGLEEVFSLTGGPENSQKTLYCDHDTNLKTNRYFPYAQYVFRFPDFLSVISLAFELADLIQSPKVQSEVSL